MMKAVLNLIQKNSYQMTFKQLLEGSFFSYSLRKNSRVYQVIKKSNQVAHLKDKNGELITVPESAKTLWNKPVFLKLDFQ